MYAHVPGGSSGGFTAATLGATYGRARCYHHDLVQSPRRAVSTDRLLAVAGRDVSAAMELVAPDSQDQGQGGGGPGGAASPDILPGSDLESLVNSATLH